MVRSLTTEWRAPAACIVTILMILSLAVTPPARIAGHRTLYHDIFRENWR